MEIEEGVKGDQEVAVNPHEPRTRRDRWATRHRRLRAISEDARPDQDQVSRATKALKKVYEDGGRSLTHVVVRRSFITRREPARGEMSDRRPPRGQDPPALEIASPRGIALQLELVALFVAQVQSERHKDGRVTFGLDLDTTDAGATDWIDLVVPHTDSSPLTAYASSRRDDRLRQLKRALDSLAVKSLVDLPNVGRARGKYEGFRLLDEGGERSTGLPLPYRVPKPQEHVVDIPIDFFLQGWVYVLTPSETALWLMLRDLRQQRLRRSGDSTVVVNGDTRLRIYGVKKDAYKEWWLLNLAGLLDVQIDSKRRDDGTVVDFDPADPPSPHRFNLTDDGVRKPAAAAVKGALTRALSGEPIGVARAHAVSGLPSP